MLPILALEGQIQLAEQNEEGRDPQDGHPRVIDLNVSYEWFTGKIQ